MSQEMSYICTIVALFSLFCRLVNFTIRRMFLLTEREEKNIDREYHSKNYRLHFFLIIWETEVIIDCIEHTSRVTLFVLKTLCTQKLYQ